MSEELASSIVMGDDEKRTREVEFCVDESVMTCYLCVSVEWGPGEYDTGGDEEDFVDLPRQLTKPEQEAVTKALMECNRKDVWRLLERVADGWVPPLGEKQTPA